MIKVNFYAQLLLVVLCLIMGLSAFFNTEPMFMLLYIQFFVGVSQFFGGLILSVVGNAKHLKLYWRLVFVYILIMSSIFSFEKALNIEKVYVLTLFIIPWALAIYYWFISFKLYKANR